jgi:hypothetical protein
MSIISARLTSPKTSSEYEERRGEVLRESRTHPDYDCDNIKLDGQGPMEEDVHRRHGVAIYSGTAQRRSKPAIA